MKNERITMMYLNIALRDINAYSTATFKLTHDASGYTLTVTDKETGEIKVEAFAQELETLLLMVNIIDDEFLESSKTSEWLDWIHTTREFKE